MPSVQALWFADGKLSVIDQRRLPLDRVVLELTQLSEAAEAIRNMTVRGAPTIGVTAAYAMVLAHAQGGYTAEQAAEILRSTRPTAHDLFVGVDIVRKAWEDGRDVVKVATDYRHSIVEQCHAIGIHGAPLFPRDANVLTHCNAGALATVEWGTALAPIRVAWREGRLPHVWVDETRPLLQGSRLTAWELREEGIPHTILADNAAGFLLQRKKVDLVIVGADRITTSGDFANKIGTYEKAVLAHEHGVPFYVAAPWSTFDPTIESGSAIPIEERAREEVTTFGGVPSAPADSPAWNPAFDVTPARLVTAFITPGGMVRPGDLKAFLKNRGEAR